MAQYIYMLCNITINSVNIIGIESSQPKQWFTMPKHQSLRDTLACSREVAADVDEDTTYGDCLPVRKGDP